MKKNLFICMTGILFSTGIIAQNNTFPATGAAGIGTTAPNTSSLLEIRSTTRGLLIPRMTQAQRNGIASPATGLLIYQTNNTPGFYNYNGSAWVGLSGANLTLSNLSATTAINVNLLPSGDNAVNLGSNTLRWKNLNLYTLRFADASQQTTAFNPAALNQALVPNIDNSFDLGSSSFYWRDIYFNNLIFGDGSQQSSAFVPSSLNFSMLPGADNSFDLGNSNFLWRDAYMYNLFFGDGSQQTTAFIPSALNQILLPNADNTLDFGSSSFRWRDMYLYNLNFGDGTQQTTAFLPASLSQTLLPSADNTFDLGSLNSRWRIAHLYNLIFADASQQTTAFIPSALSQTLLPSSDNTIDLGSSSFRWKDLHLNNLQFADGSAQSTAYVPGATSGSLIPSANNAFDIGDPSFQWKDLYLANSINIGGSAYLGGSIYVDGQRFLYGHSYSNNVFLGTQAGISTTTATSFNTGIGHHALISNTTGSDNTVVGSRSSEPNSTGSGNTVVGAAAMGSNSTGSNNTAIGVHANIFNFDNSIAIGANVAVSASNKAVIGNSAVSEIGGQVGWSTFSDGRFKKDIKQNVPGLVFITKLKPVTYQVETKKFQKFLGIADSISNLSGEGLEKSEQKLRTGFVAQDVEKAADEIGYNFSGLNKPQNEKDNYSLVYADFVPSLVKSVQELSVMIDKKDKAFEDLEKENKEQQQIINNLITRLDKIEAAMSQCCTVFQQSTPENKTPVTGNDAAKLDQNIPNPFSQSTTVKYYIPTTVKQAQLVITDMNGKRIKQQVINISGYGQITINGGELSPGTYAYTLYADGKMVDSKKMILTK